MRYKTFHKTKAFTLSEMLVVMVTSLIIIGLCFTVIRLIDNYFYTFRTEVENQTLHLSLEHQLWNDFNRFDLLELRADQKLFLMDANDTVVYQFFPNNIVRQKDTLWLQVKQLVFFNSAEPVQAGSIEAMEMVTGDTQSFSSFVFRYPSVFDFNLKNF